MTIDGFLTKKKKESNCYSYILRNKYEISESLNINTITGLI